MRGKLFIMFALAIATALSAFAPAGAQTSRCFAIAETIPNVRYAALSPRALTPKEVYIRFVGHSTFLMESAEGVLVATDYAGWAGFGVVPDIVTMNNAHETHYTDIPDPGIKHVLRGWDPAGGVAVHNLRHKDVHIRNVTTDRRGWGGGVQRDANSIFVFEVADLCIAHLGHLHHELPEQYRAVLGAIDILMVPVDGTFTLSHDGMIDVVKTLRARLILPMHYFGGHSLAAFLNRLGGTFPARVHDKSDIIVSQDTLPSAPEILVLPAGH
jgi:L-ascorbate metabolism protein UlaG (beta-lactamase superfamily)